MLIDQSGRWQNTARNFYLFTPTKKTSTKPQNKKKNGEPEKKNLKENTKIFSEKG